MANPVRIKRRAVGGAAGAPSNLLSAEPAYNEQDDVLYYGKGDNGSGTATSIIPIAGKGAFVDVSTAQTVGGIKTFTSPPNVPAPASGGDAANRTYVDGKFPAITGGTATKITYNSSGLITSTTSLAASDIPTLTASKISDFDTQVRTSRLDQMAAPTGAVSLNAQRITGLADPSANTDAATKQYVDSAVAGTDWKASVRIASTANLPLSGLTAIDGITPSAGDRVLAKDQTTGAQNGIYVAASGAWSRAADADAGTEVTSGLALFVEEGTTNAGKQFILATTGAITIGTTSLAFTQFGGGSTYSAGLGIGISGSTFFVAAGTGMTQDADGLSISASYAGQTSITTLGTVTSGTWNAGVIGLAYGGTGANLSAIADGTIFKKSGTTFVAAVAGTDFLSPSSTIDGGTF